MTTHAASRSTDPAPSVEAETHPARRLVISVMSRPVVAVTEDRPLAEALEALVATGSRHVIVVDRGWRCLGILSDRMLVAAWAHDMTSLTRRRVVELLEPEQAIVDSDATIAEVARVMHRLGVDAVAVIGADGSLAGIVTGSDLIAVLGDGV
jgi:CBS domain-containing protein